MTIAPAAWAVACAAGVVTAVVAWIALRAGRRPAAVGAAIARGAAVALAVLAASGPMLTTETRVRGETLVAAARRAEVGGGDLLLHWPDDAPDAAASLETLRAARDAGSPASLVLVAGADVGRGRDLAPAANALRPREAVDPAVLALLSVEPTSLPGDAPRIIAPSGATEGVPFALTLDAGARPFDAGDARVEIDGRPTVVALSAGSRRAATPPLAIAAGTHVVVATVPGRRAAASIVDVAGPPRVLVVSAGKGAIELVAILRTQGIDVADVRDSDLRADDVDQCAALVLGPGVTCGPLADEVAARVRGGAGLLVIGGDGHAGLSRLRGSAVEPLLPVVLPPPPAPPPEPPAPPPPVKRPDPSKPKPALDEGEKEALRVALLLAVDTSGSMAGTKLAMAQQSAIAAARALSPADRVGVVAFDDDAREIAPFQDAIELETLFRRIAGLRASGQTNYFPALKIGYRRILEQPCGIRHIVLLTDGMTAPALFQDLIEGGAEKGVTLSTVAIGDDANTQDLARQATWGRGKWYEARDPTRLPEIITLDTRRFTTDKRDAARRERAKADAEDLPEPPSSGPPVDRAGPPGPPRDGPPLARPHVVTPAAFLAGIPSDEWPALPFAETAPARAASQVVLAWDDGSPALALGRAALGRVAVFAAGVTSSQADEFRRWAGAPQLLAQLVRGLVEPPAGAAGPVDVRFLETDDGRAFAWIGAGGGGTLGLDSLGPGTSLSAQCRDRGASSIVELAAMPPAGVYAGTFAAPGAAPRRAVAVSSGPRDLAPDAARRIARISGARLVDRIPAAPDGVPVRRDEPRSLPLLAGAAGLLAAEAALRRIARSAA